MVLGSMSLRLIEERFQQLDRVQAYYDAAARKGRHRGGGATAHRRTTTYREYDPEPDADRQTHAGAESPVEANDIDTTTNQRVYGFVARDEQDVRHVVQEDIARHVHAVKSSVTRFMSDSEANKNAAKRLDMYEDMPRSANAYAMDPNDPNNFVELFMDEKTFAMREATAKLSARPKSPSQTLLNVPGMAASVSHRRPTTAGPTPPSSSAKDPSLHGGRDSASSRPSTAAASKRPQSGAPPTKQSSSGFSPSSMSAHHHQYASYVNKNPAVFKRWRPASARAAQRAAGQSASGLDGERLAQNFFRKLPPVIPSLHPSGKHAPKQVDAPPAMARAASPVKPPSALQRQLLDVVYQKQFYYIHVRVLHTTSKLQGWVFTVVVSDITHPERVRKHTIRGLAVNENMNIVFHPPGNVILSPVDDIPWVETPQSLYMHTLRIEVVATHPVHSKVVDTMVYFGDHPPKEAPAAVLHSPQKQS